MHNIDTYKVEVMSVNVRIFTDCCGLLKANKLYYLRKYVYSYMNITCDV